MDRNAPEKLEINCEALGIVGCKRLFRGKTAGEVVDQVREHLRSEHDISLPETEVILRTDEGLDVDAFVERFLGMGYSKKAVLIVRRLRELLNVQPAPKDEQRI